MDEEASLLGNLLETNCRDAGFMTVLHPAPLDVASNPMLLVDAAVQRGLDRAHVATLVAEAPPLWVSWGTVESRADDLALVVRPLGPNDLRVRVNAPTDASREWEITVVAADRPGLLSITATVLAQNHVTVVSARVATWPSGQALQTLRVRPDETSSVEPPWPFIGQDLRHALLHGAPHVGAPAFSLAWVREWTVLASLVGTIDGERVLVQFDAPDELGVLATIAGALAGAGCNIISGSMSSAHGRATDTLVIDVPATASKAVRALLGTDAYANS
jgi:UTP:GlnB (protein PII) uridylyltransferase